MRKRKIGLLGGSFNPAHEGHRQISLIALRHLDLDEVWWLVSPQNPLKSTAEMASHQDRFASAQRVADHPKIKVSDYETRAGTQYTTDTLSRLSRRYRDTQFVWLMGADNLAQLSKWRNWREIMHMVPIAVIDRPGYSHTSLRSIPALCYRGRRFPARHLMQQSLPAWSFICDKRSAISATYIRNKHINAGKACPWPPKSPN